MRRMRQPRIKLLSLVRKRASLTGAVITGYGLMGISGIVNLLLVPLYLKALGHTGFGMLMMLIGLNAYAGIGMLWLFGGINRRLGVAFAQNDRRKFAVIWAAGKWGTLGGAIILAVLLALLLWIAPELFGSASRKMPEFPLTLALFVVQLAIGWLYSIDRLALAISGRQSIANLLLIGQQVLLGGLVYVVLAFDGGLPGVMAAYVGSQVLTLVASSICRHFYIGAMTWHSPISPVVWEQLRAMLSREGTGYQVFGILALSLQADVLLVGLIGGPAIAAEFVIVWKIAEFIIQALWRIPDVTQPKIIQLSTHEDEAALKALLQRVDWVVLPLAGAAGIAYALLGHNIIELWLGAAYTPNNRWIYILAGCAIFWVALARLPISAAYVTGRMNGLLQVMAIEFFGKLIIIALSISSIGIMAPLVAINAVHTLGVAYGYRWVLRDIGNFGMRR